MRRIRNLRVLQIGWRLKSNMGEMVSTDNTVLCDLGIKISIVARTMIENLASIRVKQQYFTKPGVTMYYT